MALSAYQFVTKSAYVTFARVHCYKIFLNHNMNGAITKVYAPSVQNSTDAISKLHSNEDKISKSVFISQSSDVFTNLALEDWLYRNFDFTNHQIMLLWRNAPCVVIGRHQNPWLEANLGPLAERGIEVARRNSGGGTVYHDGGNLNFTFFTHRERYNRKQNLQLIGQALQREWGLHTKINQREDIVINDKYKNGLIIVILLRSGNLGINARLGKVISNRVSI